MPGSTALVEVGDEIVDVYVASGWRRHDKPSSEAPEVPDKPDEPDEPVTTPRPATSKAVSRDSAR